jgi:hypothetical protein
MNYFDAIKISLSAFSIPQKNVVPAPWNLVQGIYGHSGADGKNE